VVSAPDPRRLSSRLLAVGTTSALAFVVLAVEAASGRPNRIDVELAHLLSATKSSVAFRMADVLSFGGSPIFVVVAAFALAVAVWRQRRDRALALLCVVAPGIAGLLQLGVKALVGPQQPVFFDPWFPDRTLAFPSGHATGAACIATLVIVLTLTSPMPSPRRRLVIGVAVLSAATVAASRVVIDDHLAMDALGGLLLGTAVASIGAALTVRTTPVVDRRRTPGLTA
jgi:undecaprenyl-diphosphatase